MRIDNVVTSGLFKLDGGEWEVDNNVWIVGDDSEVADMELGEHQRSATPNLVFRTP